MIKTEATTGLQSYSMHENTSYSQLLKVLHAVNHKETHHLGYFSQK